MNLDTLNELKAKYPGYAVVAYINTTSELKTGCDVCVTSASAVKICKALDNALHIRKNQYTFSSSSDSPQNFIWWCFCDNYNRNARVMKCPFRPLLCGFQRYFSSRKCLISFVFVTFFQFL